MRRSAFTLMELLVVIAIILILMGMVLGGVMYAKKAAARAKTQSLMAQITGALATYRTTTGRFPDADSAFPSLAQRPAFDAPPDWAAINTALATALRDAGEPMPTSLSLVDAWKQPFHYRPAKFYPYTPAGTNVADIDSDDPPGREDYQLWSTGPDLIDQGGKTGSDDIVSWAK
jgi:prepilin-type N-terminal cleavage/methylation domain-containing protein